MAHILVFGSTGSVGSQVCRALAKRNVPFRAAVHSISKGDAIKALGNNIEVVEVDMGKSADVEAALKGISSVFLLSPPFVSPDATLAAIDTFKKAGSVKHIVKLSACGTEDGGKFTWGKEHHEVEEHIRKVGIPLTSIRPTSFSTNLLREARSIKGSSSYSSPIVDTKMNWISTKDIGEISAVSLVEGEKHYGKNYVVTGPHNYSGAEMAKLVSDVLGKEISYVPQTLDQLKAQVSQFMKPNVVEPLMDMWAYFAKGGYDKHSKDLETVTGSKGQTMNEWLQENKAAFV